MQTPQQRCSGCNLDGAVETESDERDRSGDQPGHNGQQTFKAIVGNREIFKSLARRMRAERVRLTASIQASVAPFVFGSPEYSVQNHLSTVPQVPWQGPHAMGLCHTRSMKNFHLPLPDDTYEHLRSVAERSKVPATTIAREAIDFWLRQQLRKARHDAIAAYAAELAGTALDLDSNLEAAGIEHLMATGRESK